MIKHKKGKANVVADALSRRYVYFLLLKQKFLVLSILKSCMKVILNFIQSF